MYTIKHAARLTGVSEATLRAWERRYGLVTSQRTPSGYRVYDDQAIAALAAVRRLIEAGWSPAEAAQAVRTGQVPTDAGDLPGLATRPTIVEALPASTGAVGSFVAAAATLDIARLERSLDRGFALGSFEHVVESWLFPALAALGEGWARGEVDVAGEHLASQAVHRRLSAAFDAAGVRPDAPSVVVGLPPGSHHELGALAFATAARRRGLHVLYLGSDVPVSSWAAAVRAREADAAVMAVVTAEDRDPAAEVAAELASLGRGRVLVGAGGAHGADVADGVRTLATSVSAAASELATALRAGIRA